MPPAPRSWPAVTALLVVGASTHDADIVDPELGLIAAAELSFEPGKFRDSSTVGGADDVDSGWQLDLYNEQSSPS